MKFHSFLRNINKPSGTAVVLTSLLAIASSSTLALNLSEEPLFLTQNQPPLVMLTMGRDHRFYYEAYNDASDLDGDGVLDISYKPATIDYYGYFDSLKCYTYDGSKFVPSSSTTKALLKKCAGSNEWSGDWLNYNTTSRMDALRKVLFGGKRSTDTATETIIERSFIPQDAHGWAKKYESIAIDGYDIRDYTPLSVPNAGQRHLFGNVTLNSVNDPPLLRVASNVIYQPWEWASIERPVLGDQCATGNNSRQACTSGGGGGSSSWTVNADATNGISWGTLNRATYDISSYFSSGNDHPSNSAQFQDLVTGWAVVNKTITNPTLLGSDTPSQIKCSNNCNPGGAPNNQQDKFLTIITGTINIATAGNYKFFLDGDDAVDIFIDGTHVVGYYGGHGDRGNGNGLNVCSSPQSATSACYADISLTAGNHSIKARHEEASGGENYNLYMLKSSTGGSNNLAELGSTGLSGLNRSTYKLDTHFASGPTSGNFDSSRHPINKTGMDYLETNYTASTLTIPIQIGSGTVTTINCNSGSSNCQPYTHGTLGSPQNKYMTVITGNITVATEDDYKFAIDGDDAVELLIDGNVVTGWYGGHGFSNDTSHAGTAHLSMGTHTIEFRHEEKDGGDGYKLQWQKSGGASALANYNVRVVVCDSSISLESNCTAYVDGATTTYKPTGLLHKYGNNNGMYFGLLSGSYINNTAGGVLRRGLNSFSTELNTNGTFSTLNGIVSTINKFKIDGFNYSSQAYDGYDSGTVTDTCGWITTRAMKKGECQNWGNPIGEMIYETVRYFSGKGTPTSSFTYSSTDTKIRDNQLGLPLASWGNPYGTGGYAYCSKPYALVISDVYPSFDSDSVPGSRFCKEEDKNSYPCSGGTTFSGDVSGLDVVTEGQSIWNSEFSNSNGTNIFIGQSGTTYDNSPSPKTASSFGNLRGLAPSDPTRQGSYTSAEVSYWAHRTDLNAAAGDQKLSFFSVALAAPLPEISIPIAGKTVKFVPFAKSVGGSSIGSTSASFQPTNQIVDFYIETIKNVATLNEDVTINEGRPYYKFRINYEDVEQGADHDMDAISLYEIFLNPNDTITVKMSSDYAAGGIMQHMGYVVSGGTETDINGTAVSGSPNNIYLNVRDSDTAAGSDPDYFLDTPNTSGTALPLVSTRYFKTDAASSVATLLKDPLWYSAKYGGFADDNANSLPDTTEWDADNDGVPDNYFLVINPLKLEQQLGKALAKIQNDSGTAAALATNSQSFRNDLTLYQARFSSDGWGGELNAYSVSATGVLSSPIWQAQYVLATQSPESRLILTYDPDIATVDGNGRPLRGIPFKWASMINSGTLQTSLNKTWSGTTDTLGSDRLSYLRGGVVSGLRTRPTVKGTSTSNLLGDIVNSAIQFVGAPSFGYAESSYLNYYNAKKSRDPMVYVGSNDGMLHGFDAATGAEKISYIPSALYRNYRLNKLTAADYGKTSNPHTYFVDGTPTVGDVCSGTCSSASDWKTILVGGLNRGGQGIYALNISNPDDFSEGTASSTVLWEFNDSNDNVTVATDFGYTDDSNSRYSLGYTYSRPAIVRICTQRDTTSTSTPKICPAENRKWVVVFGNGYNNSDSDGYASATGHAMFYVLDALTGNVLTKISTKAGSPGTPNGLATVAPDDADGDTVIDYVYGGDLLGNMWKFDLSGNTPADWKVAYGTATTPAPLYIAKNNSGSTQPITTSPEIASHPFGGTMVLFGTGKYIERTVDPSNNDQQSFYGIRDNNALVSSLTPRSNLQAQTIDSLSVSTSNGNLNSGSSIEISDWSSIKGWYIDLPETRERVGYDPRLFGEILYFPTLAPSTDICDYGGNSWDYFVNYLTGGALLVSPFEGVGKIQTSVTSVSGIAVRRKSEIGISPTGTSISAGRGQGRFFKGGSTGGIEGFGVNLGTNQGRRIAWRELTAD